MLRNLLRIYVAYLVVGLLLIPPALNFLTPWYLEKTLGRKFQSELILFNPFALSVEVRGAKLAELDTSPFIAFSSAQANLSMEGLWAPGWVFDAIAVKSLSVNIHRLPSGDFNFSDLLAADDSAAEDTDKKSGIPGITIHNFFFHADAIKIRDDARETPFSTHYQGLEIAVTDLSTVIAEDKPYQLSVRGEGGGQLNWEGTISIPNSYSEGYLSLSGLSLKPVSRFIAPWVRFEIAEGQLAVEGQYRLDWAGEFNYAIEQASVGLDNIDITPQDPVALPDTAVSLHALSLTGLAITGEEERAEIESIAIKGLAISGWSKGQDISLPAMFAPRGSTGSEEPDGENAWSVGIAKTVVQDSRLRWHSEYTSPPELIVSPLNITVLDVQWPPTGDSRLQADLAVNEVAKLEVNALLSLGSGDGTIHYTLEDLPVRWFNPNLPSGVNAKIKKGQAHVDGQLALAGFAPASVSLNGRIDDFSIEVEEAENAITAWDSVRWNQLNADFTQQKVVLNEFFVDGYSGRLHIYEDGSINTQKALMEDTKSSPAEDQEQGPPWDFEIPSITITDSALDFMDQSLPIAFRTVIGDLNGEIRNISSDPLQVTRVDIKGSVDSYAPVLLAGSARPFATPPALDLGMNFDGVDLARLTPYSSTYAGYAIDRGILNLDLKYKLEDDQLAGHNQIIIKQLKLGEKIDSNKAADLPVDLAIALLTDMNGVIDLAVPVSGDVNDPEFSLGSVIFSALGNIIIKAVTAPFSLLASLVSSEEDLQRITFASGSIELDEIARGKLGDLQAALTQRPELILVIRGRLHPRADLEYMQLSALKSELTASGLPEPSWESKDEQWARAIDARYKTLAIDTANDDSPASPSNREKLEVIQSTISIPESLLQTLAEDRAVEVKRYLVNEAGLPADRAVIETFDITDEENIFSGVEMKIDS
ncbi:MAG: DUF748 domain-containing protein [Halioglobus sp.]